MSGDHVMSADEFEEAIDLLELHTDADIARRIGVHRSTVSRWRSSAMVISRPWAKLIQLAAQEARQMQEKTL